MAQETSVEKAMREAAERAKEKREREEAEKKAREAEEAANKRADEDPQVAASKKRQEEEEAKADAEARRAEAQEFAMRNSKNAAAVGLAAQDLGLTTQDQALGGVPSVTANAGGDLVPADTIIPGQPLSPEQAQQQVIQPQKVALAAADPVAKESSAGWKTYQHQYANANTILPNGKKIIFGGMNGSIGQYSTNVPSQIEHLDELAQTPGSMITEVRKDSEGRFVVVTDAILQAEQQAALIDSRTNSAADLNPNVVSARANLARQIAQDS